jgi:hypothetical protein
VPASRDRNAAAMPSAKVKPFPLNLAPIREWIFDVDYREGFFHAADNLVLDLLEEQGLRQVDSERRFGGLKFPILFCYRHYIEVSLKALIALLRPLSGLPGKTTRAARMENPKGIARSPAPTDLGHELMPLWNEFKRQAAAVFPPVPGSAEVLTQAERTVNTFHMVDPASQVFRYRRSTSGKLHDERIPKLELPRLLQDLRALRAFFSACEGVARDYKEYDERAEWQRD